MNCRAIVVWLTCLITVLLICCKKSRSSLSYEEQPTSFDAAFANFWDKMNTHYVYWDIDTTDWHKIYDKYEPIFEKLDINNDDDIRTSISYFREMTAGLLDSHFRIQFLNPVVSDTFISPTLNRKKNRKDFRGAYPYEELSKTYLDPGYVFGSYVTRDNKRLTLLCGTISKSILYFHCNRFSLQEAWNSRESNSAKDVLRYFFNELKKQPNLVRSVIVDVRNNHGGRISDLNFFMGHLIDTPLKLGFTRYKVGDGRLAYSSWIPAVLKPCEGSSPITIPVIALADNYTMSLAEVVTMAIHRLPSGIVIGEKTWGATGPVTSEKVYNAGSFVIPGFLSVTTSSAQFKYIDGAIFEGIGFPPDIEISFNGTAIENGRDEQLEKAISLGY